MKKSMLNLLFVFFIGLLPVLGQSVKVITYNIRYDNASDGENRWSLRKDKIVEMFGFYEPDVFGIQEGLSNQLAYLDSCLPQYHYLGIGRDDGKTQGEYCAIFYKKDIFEVIQTSTFWLSETPDTVSRGWDAACNRICTYVLLKNKKTHQKLWVFNTHFDHIGKNARQNSAILITERIKQLNKKNYPVVLMGDFNMTPDEEPIKYISNMLKDSKLLYKGNSRENEGTFNAFEFCKPVTFRIDFIFTGGLNVKKYRILTDSYQCRYLSDHLPVMIEITQ